MNTQENTRVELPLILKTQLTTYVRENSDILTQDKEEFLKTLNEIGDTDKDAATALTNLAVFAQQMQDDIESTVIPGKKEKWTPTLDSLHEWIDSASE